MVRYFQTRVDNQARAFSAVKGSYALFQIDFGRTCYYYCKDNYSDTVTKKRYRGTALYNLPGVAKISTGFLRTDSSYIGLRRNNVGAMPARLMKSADFAQRVLTTLTAAATSARNYFHRSSTVLPRLRVGRCPAASNGHLEQCQRNGDARPRSYQK